MKAIPRGSCTTGALSQPPPPIPRPRSPPSPTGRPFGVGAPGAWMASDDLFRSRRRPDRDERTRITPAGDKYVGEVKPDGPGPVRPPPPAPPQPSRRPRGGPSTASARWRTSTATSTLVCEPSSHCDPIHFARAHLSRAYFCHRCFPSCPYALGWLVGALRSGSGDWVDDQRHGCGVMPGPVQVTPLCARAALFPSLFARGTPEHMCARRRDT